jgi:N-acetylglucosaminyldiphosphoundecaprenol N-acetyl-beta-D-mannosaminyltransferase
VSDACAEAIRRDESHASLRNFNAAGATERNGGRGEDSPTQMVAAGSGKAPRRITLGHLPIDAVTCRDALDVVEQLVNGNGGTVFTPNVDHIVLAEDNERFRDTYSRVSLSIADGMPLIWASRLLREPLPEKISGSDFVPVLLERAAKRGWRVYLLGGAPGVGVLARDKLLAQHPNLQIVGVDAPRFDADDPPETRVPVLDRVRTTRPHIVLVAFGAPKQELWIDFAREALRPAVLMGVGATLDFIAGTMPRAPRWMSASGLEWLFRLVREPRRLWKRYLVRDPRFLVILGRKARERRRSED